jgi:hypothetical protein
MVEDLLTLVLFFLFNKDKTSIFYSNYKVVNEPAGYIE